MEDWVIIVVVIIILILLFYYFTRPSKTEIKEIQNNTKMDEGQTKDLTNDIDEINDIQNQNFNSA